MSQDTTDSNGKKAGTTNQVNFKSFSGIEGFSLPFSGRFIGLSGHRLQGLGCSAERIFPRFGDARVRVGLVCVGGLIF